MHSKFIAVNTNYVKKSLLKWGYNGNIYVINIPVSESFYMLKEDKSTIRGELNLPRDKTLILSVSNSVFRKNLDAVYKLNNIIDDKYCIIRVGTPVGNSINFNNIDDETLNKLYNACDLLLFPSLEEGEGLPVIEAFKTGLPVVASDIAVLREVSNNNAVFINPYDVNSLYNGINEALERKDELKKNGLIEAKKYSFEIFKNKMENLYETIYRTG